jgi:diadenylate cyclase
MDPLFRFLTQLPITWWDLVDIAIVAIVIYEGLKLIRGTRAVQMGVGTLFLVVLYFFSRWAPLQTVNWAIRNLFTYVVFAAIVLFQTDLRRALAHFGRTPFFRYLTRTQENDDDAVEEVVVAATMLAEKRTGAIIALERAIGLRNYIESGIPLEAIVTHDLLVSIFQQAAPLHDGAVIIQEDRVAAAACFLPLTVNPQLSRELGSRHRAAIGLTEENDAIAVVVSEESGKISLAVDGRIERGLNGETLRRRLRELLAAGRGVPKRARVKAARAEAR